MQINEQVYIEERVDERIAFFTKKSVQHRRRFKVLKITEIVSGFLIAVFSSLPLEDIHYKIVSVILASMSLLCEGIINLYKAKEHWISYQNVAQLLEKEKYLFEGRTEKYRRESSAFMLFVSSCESLISEEISNWKDIQSKENQANYKIDDKK